MFANDVCIFIRMILDNQRMEPLIIQQNCQKKKFCQAGSNCQETDEKTEKLCCLVVPEMPDRRHLIDLNAIKTTSKGEIWQHDCLTLIENLSYDGET